MICFDCLEKNVFDAKPLSESMLQYHLFLHPWEIVFICFLSIIYTRFTVISTSRKWIWKFCLFVLLCLETSLSLHLFLFSPKDASTISQFYRRRWHRVLAFDSVWCHRWRWVSVGVVGLTVFSIRCPINIILTTDLLWYPHYWNV